jgi:hypothetical protein
VSSDAVSEYPVIEEGRQWAALSLDELSSDEVAPRVSRLTSLIAIIVLSFATWAVIWAAFAALCGL